MVFTLLQCMSPPLWSWEAVSSSEISWRILKSFGLCRDLSVDMSVYFPNFQVVASWGEKGVYKNNDKCCNEIVLIFEATHEHLSDQDSRGTHSRMHCSLCCPESLWPHEVRPLLRHIWLIHCNWDVSQNCGTCMFVLTSVPTLYLCGHHFLNKNSTDGYWG